MNGCPTYLLKCDVLRSLSSDDLARLESRSRLRSFERGDAVYLPTESAHAVYVLVSGRLKISHLTEDGKESILGFLFPGDLFGELALLDPDSRGEAVEAIERSRVVSIPADAVRELMQRRPQLALNIARLIGNRRMRLENRLKNLLYRSNRERLVYVLLDLASEHGEQTSAGIRLSLPLSHQELASIIGATRETVSVLMGELRRQGLIDSGRRRIILLQPERLARSVGSTFGRPSGHLRPSAFPRRPVLGFTP